MEKFGFGLMRLPVIDNDYSKIDIEQMKKMVDEFMAAGGTYFDTAYVYHKGNSERAFKEAVVDRYPRESFTLTDKMPIFEIKEEGDLERIFNEQLEKTGVSYFDYYWLHALGAERYDKTVQPFKAFEFIAKKKEEGLIRHIGFSFHDSAEVLDRILNDHPEVEYVQLQINYIDWEDDNVQSRKCYEVCEKHGKPVIIMEPIKGGELANVPAEAEKLMKEVNPDLSVASWAIRYAASLPKTFKVLSGMSNIAQMEDNLSYMKEFKPLDENEKETIDQVVEIIKNTIVVPCTGCRYCVTENTCPMNICIPDYFRLLNDKKQYKIHGAGEKYAELNKEYGKASDCLECGMCEEHCPQHLEIRKYLEMVKKEMEK